MKPRFLAAACALGSLALNLAVEHILMPVSGNRLLIPGLADFHPVWNYGVSFSLLRQDGNAGRYMLCGLLAIISIGVGVMAWRSRDRLSAAGYGLILGGALGNLADRLWFGGVFDFLALHLGPLPLFVCNWSDIAISAGVVLVVLEGLLAERRARST